MNKNIKKITAIALAIGTVSAAVPAQGTNLNLLTTKAYAADDSEYKLTKLGLYDSDNHTIKIYDDNDYKDRVNEDEVKPNEIYYAKTSSKKVSIHTKGPSDKYIKIFKGGADDAKGKEVDDDIQLTNDSVITTLIVKVYKKDLGKDTIRNSSNNDSAYELQYKYTIKVKYEEGKEKSDADYDNIYLDRLSVDDNMIKLSDSETKYTYNVDSNVDKVKIRATPEDERYDVTIGGETVSYDDDHYKREVELEKGENNIKIELEHNGKERVYNLVINRGNTSSTNTNTTSSNADNTGTNTNNTTINNISSSVKANQWVQTNGIWQYNDATGNPVKNTWVGNYYLQADGNMVVGWQNINGSRYYFETDVTKAIGAKIIGWKYIDGKWYCFDSQGKMQIGWVRNINDNKWYYLNTDGSMAYNTTIGGYKLGMDGAYTGK